MFKNVRFFKRYLIDECGLLIDENENEISQYKNDAGYFCSRVVDDNGQIRIMRVHRLVMLAHGELIEDWKTRLINHLDGDKENIHISNLEWSNYQDNNQHAYFEGLNRNGLPFMLYDAKNDLEYKVNNTREATKYANCYMRKELHHFIKNGSCTPCGRWWFKSWTDERPWLEVKKNPNLIPKIPRYTKYDSDILIHNYRDDSTRLVETLNQAVDCTGLNRQTIQKKLDRGDYKPVKRFSFKFGYDTEPFKTYTEEELDFIDRCVGNSQPIKAWKKDSDVVLMFTSLYEFSDFLGLKRQRASGIRTAIKKRGWYRGWTYKKL